MATVPKQVLSSGVALAVMLTIIVMMKNSERYIEDVPKNNGVFGFLDCLIFKIKIVSVINKCFEKYPLTLVPFLVLSHDRLKQADIFGAWQCVLDKPYPFNLPAAIVYLTDHP